MLAAAGHQVVTVAGEGPVDRLVGSLAWPSDGAAPGRPPASDDVAAAVADADLVVVENVCSLPLHPGAAAVVASVLRGRPAILHHYDLPWQRARFGETPGWPPDDAAWAHVTINDHSGAELAARGIDAVTIRPGVDVDARPGDRLRGRAAVGIEPGEIVLLHPVRAIERKAVPVAVRLAEALGATYWLTGPAEEGYGPTLAAVLADARCKVVHRPADDIADAYAASDAVALPSTWEGFGNPIAEAAVHRRPIVVGRYPAAEELAALGLRSFSPDDVGPLVRFLDDPDQAHHDHNAAVVRAHLSLDAVADRLDDLLHRRWGL